MTLIAANVYLQTFHLNNISYKDFYKNCNKWNIRY